MTLSLFFLICLHSVLIVQSSWYQQPASLAHEVTIPQSLEKTNPNTPLNGFWGFNPVVPPTQPDSLTTGCQCSACCPPALPLSPDQSYYCAQISESVNGQSLLHMDEHDMFYNLTGYPSSKLFRQNMQCYLHDVIAKVKPQSNMTHRYNFHNQYHIDIIPWVQAESLILSSHSLSIQNKISRLDTELYRALKMDDIELGMSVLEVAFAFIAQNSIEHKPSNLTAKFAAKILKRYCEEIRHPNSADVSRNLIRFQFIRFHDVILANMQFIEAETQLVIVQILSMIDVRSVMKYLISNTQDTVHVHSFQLMVQSVLPYQSVTQAFVSYLIDNPHWILKYITNDLMRVILQYDFEMSLDLLSVCMAYDIRNWQRKSFIEFTTFEAVFKEFKYYDPNGLKYRKQFLQIQVLLMQVYSPDRFAARPDRKRIEWLFVEVMYLNTEVYKLYLNGISCFQSIRSQWHIEQSSNIRSYFLNTAREFCATACPHQHLDAWLVIIRQEIRSWDKSALSADQVSKIRSVENGIRYVRMHNGGWKHTAGEKVWSC